LIYHQDLSNIEAAGILGISVDALESLLSRGRRHLKKRLEALKPHLLEN
jgi:RNA polymerase sigma-70 factor (ECF subfamily)